ncbi:MAG: ankyrin repeat domain-containing protein [Paracoccaceae bacterium]|nr:ankyrin repeat domain-containing protein [Paracoccaceae bacterium]
MSNSIDKFRRAAKKLRKSFAAGDEDAIRRVTDHLNDEGGLSHARALHVIALEGEFDSWPKMKLATESMAMDRNAKQDRLKIALYHGQNWVVDQLMADTPDLAAGHFGLQCALYDLDAIRAKLAQDPTAATRQYGPRSAILHLAYSKYFQNHAAKRADMMEIADLLLKNGADVDDAYQGFAGSDGKLSALYGAIGHANNMTLGQWLLDNGANPNDGESLYHSNELGHLDGLKMLLKSGAAPKGTNALLRALDFNNYEMVEVLLEHGADPNEFQHEKVGGEDPFVIPALHQAARRMCDRRMVDLLLEHGADPNFRHENVTPFAMAKVFRNPAVAEALVKAGADQQLNDQEQILADAADGIDTTGRYVDPSKLPDEYRNILRSILHLPDTFEHIKRLIAVGMEWDRPDNQGITPVQIAGWEGLPDMMGYFLKLRPDLSHVNGYGGTLLSTIMHGSENSPNRETRDHIACARLALEHGVALPRDVIDFAGCADMSAFLRDWAEEKPGQVIEREDG